MNATSSSSIFKAALQNKLNLVASQVISALQSEVESLEEEEHSLLRPKVQGMKFLQEFLEGLKIKTKRLQHTEDDFFKREQLFRQAKLRDFQAKKSQPASDLEAKKSSEEWLRSETDGSLKLDLQTRRLQKQLHDLKKNKCNKTWLKDLKVIQLRLAKKDEQCKKSLAELERENRKLKDAGCTKIINEEKNNIAPTTPEDVFNKTSQSFGANSDALREENFQLKQHLQQEFSQEALKALAREQEMLMEQCSKLQDQTKFLDSDILESKKYLAVLNKKIAQKQGLEKVQSHAREDLVTQVDSQKVFMDELLKRKQSLQHQVYVFNNQEPLLGKMNQYISELEKTSEASAYAMTQLQKIEQEHTKLSTLQQWHLDKLHAQQSLATDLERKLEQQVNNTALQEEKAELKQVAKYLFEDLQRRTESERKIRSGKNLRDKKLEDAAKEAKSTDERLKSRKAERHKVEKEQKILIQQLDQITEVCEMEQKEFLAKKERGVALQAQVQAVEAELVEAHWSCRAEIQENEVLRKKVIDMVEAMQKKSQLESGN